ncbi:gastric triacylglycerol lipase [Leptinotarsa decemlineata]|uniref:gastric triacylglycerol lipase n=1 Tax=Leptinotarsa decemlineata TaxID=7539 RepID=UPI003D30B6DE
MRIIRLLLISISVFKSSQQENRQLTKKFLNSTLTITPPPNAGLNIYQVLQKYGYPVETHSVTTEDGYILRMHRIPRGRNEYKNDKSKPAILLIHGMLSGSADWLLLGPERSLGYQLADAGFDVWLGNNRGNTWSRNHVRLDPNIDLKQFWDFSFEDCGRYDLPAKIDFIIEKTGQKKIFFIGHSQGTTEFFAMAALRPDYNNKIALMTAFAPVAYLENLISPLLKLAARHLNILTGSPYQEVCANILFLMFGFNHAEMEMNLIPVLGSNSPAGASIKMIIHYGQGVNSGKFKQYDYGRTSNLIRYGTPEAPDFNLSAVTTPVALYYGNNDFITVKQDVDRLASELPNVIKSKLVECRLFNHLDFIFAKNINQWINYEVLSHLKKYSTGVYAAAGSTLRSSGSDYS